MATKFSFEYGLVKFNTNNIILPTEKLSPTGTPSFLDGMDPETELDLRILGCELIQMSGILLKLPQPAMATGQILFQRYYYSKSFLRQPMETTAMACIYLASKIEETKRSLADVLNVFHFIVQQRFQNSKSFEVKTMGKHEITRLEKLILRCELRILKELGYCVHVKHSYKFALICMDTLGLLSISKNGTKFVQKCWNFLNDALRTNVYLRYSPETIACACIDLTSRVLKIPMASEVTGERWFTLFDVTEQDMSEISITILEFYERPPVDFEKLEKTMSVLKESHQKMRNKRESTDGNDDSSPEPKLAKYALREGALIPSRSES